MYPTPGSGRVWIATVLIHVLARLKPLNTMNSTVLFTYYYYTTMRIENQYVRLSTDINLNVINIL